MADSLETSIIIKAIDQATAVLNDVKKSLGDVDKVVTDSKNTVKSYSQQLKTRAEDNKEHFSNLSKTSGTAFAAVSAGVGYSIKQFSDFEKAMSNVKAITLATDEDMEKLTNQAMELGSKTVFTALESAEAMKFLGMAGLDTNRIMETLPATMDLAAGSATDLGETARIVTNVMGQFKAEASDTGRYVDVLARTVTSSKTSLLELDDAMKYIGPKAHDLGISIEETAATIGLLSNAGLSGSISTRTLRTAIAGLANPSKETSTAISKLGLKLYDTKGNFVGIVNTIQQLEKAFGKLNTKQQQMYLDMLFGSEATTNFSVLLSEGSEKLAEYTKMLEDSGGTAEYMAKTQLDNLSGSFEYMTGALDGVVMTLGEMFAPEIRKLMDSITPLLDILRDWMKDNPELTKTIVGITVGVTGLLTAIGLLGLALPTLIGGIGVAIGILSGPIGWITGAIALVAIARANDFGGMKDKIDDFVKKVGDKIDDFVEKIKEKRDKIFGGNEDLKKSFESISKFIDSAFGWIISGVLIDFQIAFEALLTIVGGVINQIMITLGYLLNTIINIGALLVAVFTGDWGAALELLKMIFNDTVVFIVDSFENLINTAIEWGGNLVAMFVDGIESKIEDVKKSVSGIAQTVKDFLGFSSPTKLGPGSDSDKRAPNFIKMFASGLEQNKSSVTSAAKNVAQSMADSFNNFSVDVNKQLSELKTNVQKQALSMVEDIKKIQKSMSDLDLNFSEDQASDDLGIAQSYVKQAETIKDLEKEISEARKKEDMTSSDMVKLQELEKQLSEEKSAYENLAWIKTDLDAAYREAVRLNDMTEIERQAEEYQKRKAQRLQEYEEKKAQLTKELNDAKVQATNLVATYENMKQAIMEQYKVASEYYQATIADNTLKTKDNAEKMVEYYNQVANAIKNTVKELQSLQSMGGTASMIQVPKFATGGIVQGTAGIDNVLARVSPGELILNRAQQENVANQLTSSGQTIIVNIAPTIYGDNEEYAQQIGDLIVSELKYHTRTESY